MEKNHVKKLCLVSLFTALVALGTMFIQIPVTTGYVHLGDCFIFLVAIIFGAKFGMIAGGLGSFLADILLGYGIYAPFSLLIKGLMGFVVGKFSSYSKNENFYTSKNFIGILLGGIIMIAGYFSLELILTSTLETAIASLVPNLIQATSGLILYSVFGVALKKLPLRKFFTL